MENPKDQIEGYVIKYALTGHVKYVKAQLSDSGRFVCVDNWDGRPWALFTLGTEFCCGRDEAVSHIEGMREKKLASLRKQIAKIEAIDPEKVVG